MEERAVGLFCGLQLPPAPQRSCNAYPGTIHTCTAPPPHLRPEPSCCTAHVWRGVEWGLKGCKDGAEVVEEQIEGCRSVGAASRDVWVQECRVAGAGWLA